MIDSADRCPNTPQGDTVDAEGCQVLFEATKKTLILEGVNFETGKSALTPESQTILNGVAESLVANDEIKVQVDGHTDNTGSASVNARLSKRARRGGAAVPDRAGRCPKTGSPPRATAPPSRSPRTRRRKAGPRTGGWS